MFVDIGGDAYYLDVGDVAERLDGVYPWRIVASDARAIRAAAAEVVVWGQRSNGWDHVREISSAAVSD